MHSQPLGSQLRRLRSSGASLPVTEPQELTMLASLYYKKEDPEKEVTCHHTGRPWWSRPSTSGSRSSHSEPVVHAGCTPEPFCVSGRDSPVSQDLSSVRGIQCLVSMSDYKSFVVFFSETASHVEQTSLSLFCSRGWRMKDDPELTDPSASIC